MTTRVFPALPAMLCVAGLAIAGIAAAGSPMHVVHYDVHLEPSIRGGTLTGRVTMMITPRAAAIDTVYLDCGALSIDSVHADGDPVGCVNVSGRLTVGLRHPIHAGDSVAIRVWYHGTPQSGMFFNSAEEQLYTVFNTSQWMVCNDAPEDRATLRLEVVLPAELNAVASGRPVSIDTLPDHTVLHTWLQPTPVPSYTFGVIAGKFNLETERDTSITLRFLSAKFQGEQLRKIFRETQGAARFFSERAGVPYDGDSYSQVLVTNAPPQEMAGCALLGADYGEDVMSDEHEIWLIAHELAHQWWGNMVTCRDWNHFWLNEAMATFMAAAYTQHRFGEEQYQREINLFRARFERVRDAGKDHALVYTDWSHPTGADRTIVYYKGAYVLHALRLELGEENFWQGVRYYTQRYWGRSVTTADFQQAMELATGRKLGQFFAKWVF